MLQLVAGGLIVAGQHVTPAAFVLALFTLATALVFYDFWSKQGAERALVLNGFMEHLSMIGGFLALAAFGPGHLTL